VSPYTMTDAASVLATIRAVAYIARYRIPGDIVECGVWRGGSMMAAALALLEQRDLDRELCLFDTFEGMPPPTDRDRNLDGRSARQILAEARPGRGVWCYASIDDVQQNMAGTGYPPDRIRYVPGRVEQTLPAATPAAIACLRLDTDWYESTLAGLVHLFPRVSAHGVLLLDDYGYWRGAREAVDEYFSRHWTSPVYLHQVGGAGRMVIKSCG
jgi:O-methyltransferase